MSQQHYGPHNSAAVLNRLLSVMAACGEAAQGIVRNNHHAAVAVGKGIVGATGDPLRAAQQAAQEAQLGARQIALGIQSANAAWDALQAALSVAPNQPAPKPESRATAVAEAAGTTAPAPRLALAE